MLTEAQLQERKKGIGGSDLHNILNEKPYGCSRKLWYDKTGQEQDHPVVTTSLMQRGNVLEDIVAAWYVDATGRKVRRMGSRIRKSQPWARVNIDRAIVGGERGPGVLECKTHGREIFYRLKRDGLPASHVLQLQWGMFVTGYTWGSFAVLWPDGWQFIHFDVERDDEMIALMFKAAGDFWKQVENGPAPHRLDPKDKRCQECPFRTTCQGELLLASVNDDSDVETDPSLEKDLNEFLELKKIQAEATDLVKQKQNELAELIGSRPAVECDGHRIYYRPVETKRIDTRRLKAEKPELYEKYTNVSVSRPMRIYST